MPTDFFIQLKAFLNQKVTALANKIDKRPTLLGGILKEMATQGLMVPSLMVSMTAANVQKTKMAILAYHIELARYSGALAFMQHQHAVAFRHLNRSDNNLLREKFIPKMLSGKLLVGNAISYVVREGQQPGVSGYLDKNKNAYVLQGEVPWATGFGLLKKLLIGFRDVNGNKHFAVIPFKNLTQGSETVQISKPMELIALSSTNTVSLKLDKLIVRQSDVFTGVDNAVLMTPFMEYSRQLVIGGFLVGTCQALLDYIQPLLMKYDCTELKKHYQLLLADNNKLYQKILQSEDIIRDQIKFLQFKAALIKLSLNCLNFSTLLVGSGEVLTASTWVRISNEIKLFLILFNKDRLNSLQVYFETYEGFCTK